MYSRARLRMVALLSCPSRHAGMAWRKSSNPVLIDSRRFCSERRCATLLLALTVLAEVVAEGAATTGGAPGTLGIPVWFMVPSVEAGRGGSMPVMLGRMAG